MTDLWYFFSLAYILIEDNSNCRNCLPFWSTWVYPQFLVFYVVFVDLVCTFSFGHCVVCPSLIDVFWLLLWYLLAIVLSVLLWLTYFDYLFGIFWPLCCLSFFDWRILITSLISFGHCVVCPSLIDVFWLPLWYLLAIVLSVLLWLTSSDYLFGIF
jgi:hypothetical protein